MPGEPQGGVANQSKTRRYRRVTYDQLQGYIAEIPGVPPAAAAPLALLAFANLPAPREFKKWVLARIAALRAKRTWRQSCGDSDQVLHRIDSEIRRHKQLLARPRFLAFAQHEGRARIFLVPDGTDKKSPGSAALIIQAIDLLIVAFKRTIEYSSAELKDAAFEERELPPTAPEIVGRLLDLLGLRRKRGKRGKLQRTAKRTAAGVLKDYQRKKKLLPPGALWFEWTIGDKTHKHNARFPSPLEIIRLCRRYRDERWRSLGMNLPSAIWIPRR
jgi:hypothetical protein